jgi:predicted metal-dependent phosphoesterase TrpH
VQEPVRKGLKADETVDKIHQNGGIAVACHPGSFFVRSLGRNVDAKFDAVETINASSVPFKYSIKQAQKLASRLNASQVAGTDAHYGPELGFAYTLIEAEKETDRIIRAIKEGLCQPFGRPIPWTLRLQKILLSARRSIPSSKKKEIKSFRNSPFGINPFLAPTVSQAGHEDPC